MTKTFIDAETGELIENVVSIRTLEQDQAYKAKLEKERLIDRSGKTFIFSSQNIGGLEQLNNKDLGYFLVLQTYMDYNNMLKNTQKSSLPMNRKQMQEALKIGSNKTLVGLLKRLKAVGALSEVTIERKGKKHKAFYISSDYAFRTGNKGANAGRDTSQAVKVFIDSLQRVYSQTDINPADVGFIYKCIPFLHYTSNYLVADPAESDVYNLEFLTLADLAKAQGLTKQKATERIRNLVYDGMFVFARVKVGGYTDPFIKANPLVVYRQSKAPQELAVEFYIRPKKKV